MPSIEQSDSNNERGSIAGELANAALYSAAIEPLKGAAQICDRLAPTQAEKGVDFVADTLGVTAPKPVTDGSGLWYAQQFGSAIGSLVPVMLIHQRVNSSAIGSYGNAFKEASASLESGNLVHTAKTNAAVLGTTGMVYGSVFKPSDTTDATAQSFYQHRLLNGATDAVTFGAMGFSHPYIERGLGSLGGVLGKSALPGTIKEPLAHLVNGRVVTGIASGIPVGLLNAEVMAWKEGRELRAEDLKRDAILMGTIGGALAWFNPGSGLRSTSQKPLSDASGVVERAATDSGLKEVSNSRRTEPPTAGVVPGSAMERAPGSGVPANTLAGGDVRSPSGDMAHSVAPPDIEAFFRNDLPIEEADSRKLSSIFGDKGQVWVEYASPYVGAENALKVLPDPAVEARPGLAKYLVNQVPNVTDSTELYELQEIGANWSRVEKTDQALPIDELFFKVKTGLTLGEYQENPGKFLSVQPTESDHANFALLNATIGDAQVAGLMFHLEPPFLHIDNVEVARGFRRYGIGTELLEKLAESAGPQITKLSLDVSESNEPARNLYSKLGFEFVNQTGDEWMTLAKPLDRMSAKSPDAIDPPKIDLFELLQNGPLKVSKNLTKGMRSAEPGNFDNEPGHQSPGDEPNVVLSGTTEDAVGRVRHVIMREHRPLEARAAQFHALTEFESSFPKTATRSNDELSPQIRSYFPDAEKVDIQERFGRSLQTRIEDGTLKRLNVDVLNSSQFHDAVAERAIMGDMDAHLDNFAVTKRDGVLSIGTLDIEENDGAFGGHSIPIIRGPMAGKAVHPDTLDNIGKMLSTLDNFYGMRDLLEIGLMPARSTALIRRAQFLSQYKRYPSSISEVAQDPSLSPQLIEWMANDPDALVREAIARRDLSSTPNILAKLANDSNQWVRSAARENSFARPS